MLIGLFLRIDSNCSESMYNIQTKRTTTPKAGTCIVYIRKQESNTLYKMIN